MYFVSIILIIQGWICCSDEVIHWSDKAIYTITITMLSPFLLKRYGVIIQHYVKVKVAHDSPVICCTAVRWLVVKIKLVIKPIVKF